MRVLVDTDVLVSFLTDRDRAQQEQAAQLLGQAAEDEIEIVLYQLVLSEVVYVLVNLYSTPRDFVAQAIRHLLSLPGVLVRDQMPWPLVLELWPEEIGDFTDACLLAAAESGRVDRVATFDRRLLRRLRARGLKPHWD